MSSELFRAGTGAEGGPKGDTQRAAIDAIRGYEYQILASALAWVDLGERDRLYLEVAEDYATITEGALRAVQVRDNKKSGRLTLNNGDVKATIHRLIQLVEQNADHSVQLRYFTTAEIGMERRIAGRFDGLPGLKYWKLAAAGAARRSVKPLRDFLESSRFPEEVRQYCRGRNDEELRTDLLARINWDCGKPHIGTLREELEARLIVVGRSRFGLPAEASRRLVAHLSFLVLEKCTNPNADARFLTLADLNSAIDSTTRTSVRNEVLEALTKVAVGVPLLVGVDLEGHAAPSVSESNWLVHGSTLPALCAVVPRPVMESQLAAALKEYGAAVLVGSSGVGKSVLARVVAGPPQRFALVDFQGIGRSEVRRRIDMVFAHLGGMCSPSLILDNLVVSDPQLELSLARVFEAGRRHRCEILITSYRRPAANVLTLMGLDDGCVVECPHFTEEETKALVGLYGGPKDTWGRVVYFAGGAGHPQLTHAFVREMASEGWSGEAMEEAVRQGLSSPDVEATRDEARRRVASLLPESSRVLLYRVSITVGSFDRSLALRIGAINPPVRQPGECIDQLVGAWIESLGADRLRVSPLASRFGAEMLDDAAKERIHKTIAEEMVRRGRGSVEDMNILLIHAISGRSTTGVRALVGAVLKGDAATLEKLADGLFLRFARTDRPIFPQDRFCSQLLRIAQFKLVSAVGDVDNLPQVVAALSNEVKQVSDEGARSTLGAFGMGTVLAAVGIGNYLENWIGLLVEYVAEGDGSEYRRAILSGMGNCIGAAPESVLFAIGSADLTSVARLEHVVNQLDEIDPQVRELLLRPVGPAFSDYSLLINRPWQLQEGSEDFDARDAAIRYARMGERTRDWGNRCFTLQCLKAQAVMLDEYLDDRDGAIGVLLEAADGLGDDPILSRCLGGIYFRHGEHVQALEVFRSVGDRLGGDSEIERALAGREAAISAGNCGAWVECEKWFEAAEVAASKANTPEMQVMSVGLMADGAVATLRRGDRHRAIGGVARALDALRGIDPDLSLSAAYCHRVVRHTVLWVKCQVKGASLLVDGEPIHMEVGACSSLFPSPEILDLPLGSIDYAWYVLAEAETAIGTDLGIGASLSERLEGGALTMGEIYLRMERVEADIGRLDAVGFADHLMEYVEAAVYFASNRAELRGVSSDCPTRGAVPAMGEKGPTDPACEKVACRAIMAYGVQAVTGGGPEAMQDLTGALEARLSERVFGKRVLDCIVGESSIPPEEVSPGDESIIRILGQLHRDGHIPPKDFWMAGLRLLEWIWESDFRGVLTRSLANWVRAGWERILKEETFRLIRPRWTVVPIEEVLSRWADDEASIARILLASAEAVGCGLAGSFREKLQATAEA
ncbi:MAG: ABC transporter ATP-binding protein [Gemmatimonadaceae bacterium]|nr:ABC transporter ATP-binding protein [Gemmatimonadaceae bacterium]